MEHRGSFGVQPNAEDLPWTPQPLLHARDARLSDARGGISRYGTEVLIKCQISKTASTEASQLL